MQNDLHQANMTDATELAALAACPFCGGSAMVYRDHGRDCSFTWIGCSSCLMQTAKQAWMGTDSAHVERMTEAWNTRALASRDGGGSDDLIAWRDLYRIQTAMRYMDNGIGKEVAYRMADEDVRRMTVQLAETAKAAPLAGAVGG